MGGMGRIGIMRKMGGIGGMGSSKRCAKDFCLIMRRKTFYFFSDFRLIRLTLFAR